MSHLDLMPYVGRETLLGMIREQYAEAEREAEWEAENGMFAGDYYANVAAEDRPPNPRVSLEDDVPWPIDPFRQLSGDEE